MHAVHHPREVTHLFRDPVHGFNRRILKYTSGYLTLGRFLEELSSLLVRTSPEVVYHRMIDSGGGTARAENAQGTPTQRHISPGISVYAV